MSVNFIIQEMLDNGEFDTLISQSKGKDKKALKEFHSLVKDNPDLKNIPENVLLNAIHSLTLLRLIVARISK